MARWDLPQVIIQLILICHCEFKVLLYADDLVIITEHRHMIMVIYSLELERVDFNLNINKKKTGLIHVKNHSLSLVLDSYPLVE